MALPETVRVKLSSEAAEAIALTPVVVQDLPVRDLIELMLPLAGKDAGRIRELLLRGTLVSGASRFRWTGWAAEEEAIRAVLSTFPDPDPARPFDRARCVRVTLRGAGHAVEIRRDAGERHGLLRRATFWDVLMETAAGATLEYAGYSYRDRADRYAGALTAEDAARLREASPLLQYTTLRDQVGTLPLSRLEMWVER